MFKHFPETFYIQAQNRYGWSLPSKIVIIKPLAHAEYNGRNAVTIANLKHNISDFEYILNLLCSTATGIYVNAVFLSLRIMLILI